jgi:hypothetical protein
MSYSYSSGPLAGYSYGSGPVSLAGYSYASGPASLSGLGFSLKPPKWLRDAVSGVIHKTTVNIPTPVGPVSLSPEELKSAIKGSNVTVGPKQPSAAEQIVSNVPGGANTLLLAGLGIAGLLVFMSMSRRRRAA